MSTELKLDLVKDYDSVPLTRTFKVLRIIRIEPTYVHSIFSIHNRAQSIVKAGNEVSEKIMVSRV